MTHGKQRGFDPRDEPAYTLPEAAHYLAIPGSTLRLWVRGQAYPTRTQGRRVAPPLIVPALREPPTLSFWNLVELYVLATIRRAHGVSLQKVRKALRYVQEQLDLERPLIEQDFLTDGIDLFVEHYSHLLAVSREGQAGMKELLADSLRRIDRDPKGLAARIFPWRRKPEEPRAVEIDPARSFGRPVVTGTGVPTEVLAERFLAGDSIDALAEDFRLKREQVESAVRWEQGGASR